MAGVKLTDVRDITRLERIGQHSQCVTLRLQRSALMNFRTLPSGEALFLHSGECWMEPT